MSDILKDPGDRKRLYINPTIDRQILDTDFDQIADFMLQLFKYNFCGIGAISKHSVSNTWSVTGRPLTYTMNELATTTSTRLVHSRQLPLTLPMTTLYLSQTSILPIFRLSETCLLTRGMHGSGISHAIYFLDLSASTVLITMALSNSSVTTFALRTGSWIREPSESRLC